MVELALGFRQPLIVPFGTGSPSLRSPLGIAEPSAPGRHTDGRDELIISRRGPRTQPPESIFLPQTSAESNASADNRLGSRG